MKILITGGIGFIGQYVARRLVNAGYEVVALDNKSRQVHVDADAAVERFPGEVIVGDVADLEAWGRVPAVEGIVHLAAETGTGQSMYEKDRYTKVNIGGTDHAAKFALNNNAPIVFLSSRAVYGEGRYENPSGAVKFGRVTDDEFYPVDSLESDPHKPVSFYGETKSEGERIIRSSCEGKIGFGIVRPQNVIGYGQALHNPYTGVLAAFLARLKEGRDLSVYGDGSATRDFIHVDDVASIVVFALERALLNECTIVNAGSGHRITLTELAQYAIAGSPGSTVGIEYVEVHRAGDIEHAAASMEHLESLNGPIPTWEPRDSVADFVQKSWNEEGGTSALWDKALDELADRGLVS